MPEYRSRTTTHGRNMAGARELWRAYAAMATSSSRSAVTQVEK